MATDSSKTNGNLNDFSTYKSELNSAMLQKQRGSDQGSDHKAHVLHRKMHDGI